MTPDTRRRLEALLREAEGEVLHAYQDPAGWWSLGVGRLIDGRIGGGISPAEPSLLLDGDISDSERELLATWPWMAQLEPPRFAALVELHFTLGLTNLRKFAPTLELIRLGAYANAAARLRRTKWAAQVKNRRANRVADMIRTGLWPGLLP